jgi:glucosamine kinase
LSPAFDFNLSTARPDRMTSSPSDTLFFIGVDGGGTKCRARLCDGDGRRLGEGEGGTANPRVGVEAAFTEIMAACRAAFAFAGLDEDGLRRAHAGLGLAGLGQKRERDLMLAQPFPFASVTADTDAYAACLGAHAGGDGAILIAGTGTAGLALVGGRRTAVGGWGFEVSDDGSGAAMGRDALRRALWAHDGLAAHTPLSREIMARFSDSPEAVVDWVGTARPRDYAGFAPLILGHADRGDPQAVGIVREAASHLSRMVMRLAECGAPGICLLGGLAPALTPRLSAAARARLAAPAGDAMDGAILMARGTISGSRPPPTAGGASGERE